MRSQRGFTLIELMVSLVLFSFAIAGVLAIAVSMAQGYREQRQVVQTEGTARGALDYIADALRMASPAISNADVTISTGAPVAPDPHLIVGDIEDEQSLAATCQMGAIKVWNNTGTTGTDELEVVFASGGTVTSLAAPWTANLTAETLTDTTNLAVGDRILITDGTKGHIVKIASIGGGGAITTDAATCTLTNVTAYARGALVIRVLRAHFYVTTLDGIPNTLAMDPDGDGAAPAEPLADNVEDFQVAAGIDEDNNGSVDPLEWGFSGVVGTPATFTPGNDLRAIRISLIARAASSLVATTAAYQRQALEDHPGSLTLDTFRRRTLTSTVEIRNLGDSP